MATVDLRSQTQGVDVPPPPLLRWSRRLLAYPGLSVGVGLLILSTVLALTQERFLTVDNLRSVTEENASLLVLAVGAGMVMLTGGFDLSLGALLSLSGVGFAWLLQQDVPIGPAAVITVTATAAVGAAINGQLVGRLGLSFLVTTLGAGLAFQSLANIWTGGRTTSLFDRSGVTSLGSDRVLGVPLVVLIALLVWATAALVMRFTGFGRMVYAVGGNSEAARIAGIRTVSIRVASYGIAAGCAGVAAVLTTSRLTSASPTVGTGRELVAATAVLLGGTAFTGGRGTMGGTLLGVLFLGVLANGITLFEVSAFWQGLLQGLVLIVAGGLQLLRGKKTRRSAPA
jgi:ribose transport system permease protein